MNRYVVIEGNIGSGKTTLSGMLAEHWQARLVLEQFSDNPFLPGFYEDPQKYAFPLELSFLAERYQQLKEIFAAPDLFRPAVVADYFIHKSRIFASHNLPDLEFQLFGKLFDIIENALPAPDILMYLYSDVKRLQENIRRRGRVYEQNIPDDYLENIQQRYLEHLKTIYGFPVLLINVTKYDFTKEPEIFRKLVQLLESEHEKGLNVIDF